MPVTLAAAVDFPSLLKRDSFLGKGALQSKEDNNDRSSSTFFAEEEDGVAIANAASKSLHTFETCENRVAHSARATGRAAATAGEAVKKAATALFDLEAHSNVNRACSLFGGGVDKVCKRYRHPSPPTTAAVALPPTFFV